jgi:molybdopterin/thiamine biosynthesis adenylyltransferase
LTAADTPELGDRHHRADPMGKLREGNRHTRACVRLRISPALAVNRVGQLGAWLCVNLLARLDGLVAHIELDCPEVPANPSLRAIRLAPPEAVQLPQVLAELAHAASGGRLSLASDGSGPGAAVVELIIGGAEVSAGNTLHRVWCCGRGWLASAGARPGPACSNDIDDSNPLGMYLGVCYGVGEVFKALKGEASGQSLAIDFIFASLWSGETSSEGWDALEDGPSVATLRLPMTYLVGAGAVGQATLLAVFTATAGSEFLTPIDRDVLDLTNRNRYILTFEGDEARNKAQFAATIATAMGTPADGVPLHWLQYLGRSTKHPNSQLAANESELHYELVLSCVDKNRPRHEIQRTWPRDILGASTDSLRAQAVHYDLRTGTACLACHNPIASFDQVLDGLRRELSGLSSIEKRAVLSARGIDVEHIESALRYLDDPNCGELGRGALEKFAEDGPPAFSVGFVSVAAGLLLARHWICYALLGPASVTPPGRHYLTLNFFNGRFLWREEAQREGCACLKGGREQWRQMWT